MDSPPAPPAAPRRMPIGMLAGALHLMFLVSLDGSILGPALPEIGATIGDVDLLPWTVTAYLLAATAATPLYGRVSDLFGRRRTTLVGIALFTAGSVMCAFAPNVAVLLMGRAVQGLGGGGFPTLANAIIGDAAPPSERGRYQGFTSSAYLGGSIAGPLLGGFLAEFAHWSLIFWINLPICALAYALLYRSLPRQRPDKAERPRSTSSARSCLRERPAPCCSCWVLRASATRGRRRRPWRWASRPSGCSGSS